MNNFKDIKVGNRVKDEDGVTGIVTKIEDIHNIHVKYDTKFGDGIYCLNEECLNHYDPLTIIEEEVKNNKEGEGMCDVCKLFTKQGLYVKLKFLCRNCR